MSKATTGLMLFAVLAGTVICRQSPAPEGIKVKAPTERSIKEDLENDRKQKAYRRATKEAQVVYRRLGCHTTYAEATGRVAFDAGVSPRILAALVFVESSCNPDATSSADSVGLTQINPRVWHYSRTALHDPQRNLEIGARILSGYIRRYGIAGGLHAYNGFGNQTDEYSKKVLTAAGIQAS